MLAGWRSTLSENQILTEGQGEFRPVRGCADQVLVLSNVCDIMGSQGRQAFLVFQDVSKACDTVWREGLRMKLRE